MSERVTMVIACISAFALSFALTFPIKKYIAPKLGFMDHPTDERRMHTDSIPRGGGVVVYVVFSLCALVFGHGRTALPYILGGGIIVLCGLADDRFSLKPWVKLVCQALAGVVLCFFDVTVEHLCAFNVIIDTWIFEYPLTVLWVIAVTNAFNLIDGLDGLCSGITIISAGGVGLLALTNGHSEVFVCAMLLMCSALGFLPHNVHPASIFLGDTGSMLFGFVMAAMCNDVTYVSDTAIPSLVAVTLIGVPVFDTTYAIVRRVYRKKHIMLGDKDHVHHVLSRRYSHPKAVVLIYLASIVCVGIALLMTGGVLCEVVGYILFVLSVGYGVLRFGIMLRRARCRAEQEAAIQGDCIRDDPTDEK